MINQLKQDLAKELNCRPEEITFVAERNSQKGENVRYFSHKDLGFKVTTDFHDTTILNFEPHLLSSTIPASQWACSCVGVSWGQIKNCQSEGKSCDEIKSELKIGRDCGSCRRHITKTISQE